MNAPQSMMRRASRLRLSARPRLGTSPRQWARCASDTAEGGPRRRGGKAVGFAAVFAAAAAGAYYYPKLRARLGSAPEDAAAAGHHRAELEFEKARRQAASKEDNRELISSQHLQVKKSWEHPGVYAWGSNAGKVIDPTSNEKNVKLPRRIPYFDNRLLRDLKLTQNFGAAITEKGDLVQWGLGFSKADPTPVTTLKGKDLAKIEVSEDRIIALSRRGSVYAIPASRDDQEGGKKLEQQKSSWSLWSPSGSEAISFRNLTPAGLAWGERVADISSGLEHCLMLTSSGRVFSSASSASAFPSKGQMGIPGLSWENRPKGRYDQPHEVASLRGFDIKQMATGDYHSVVVDKLGRIFTFGDNAFGQLGFETEIGNPFISTPTILPIHKLYGSGGLAPKVSSIAAGGVNTFFACEAGLPNAPGSEAGTTAPSKRLPQSTFDLWAAGQGTCGSLGTGKWTHVSVGPTKVKALSGLSEFDERRNQLMPIKIKALSIGATHCCAIMDNVTQTSVSNRSSENETYWGSDVVFWGGNEHYQLGTGKRNNLNVPTYIGPLDGGEGDAARGRQGQAHRLCLTPRQTARLGEGGKGRKVTLEQKVESGRLVTGVYSAIC
ncbi:rrna processing [Trichoderma cornu-damae]|uniref:Rrna processing n=1 Tax=Trichoderma cornu-damae TaxID=654480 RepID=A0A9P8QIQ7_9HYPO|nr:rrna processing [Trichoderma cornu-damae]